MSSELAHWLTDHRQVLVSRWATALEDLEPPSGNGFLAAAVVQEGASLEPPYTTLDSAGAWQTLNQMYESFILAVQGKKARLDHQLRLIIHGNGQQSIALPDLLHIFFQFRRLAWAELKETQPKFTAWQAEESEGSPPTELTRFSQLADELNTLLEYAVETLTSSWVSHAEAVIRERIQQAEFIAESMAAAIEEADRATLQFSSLNKISQRLASSLESAQLIDYLGTALIELLGVAQVAIWLPGEPEHLPQPNQNISADSLAVVLYVAQAWGQETQKIMAVTLESQWAVPTDDVILQAYLTSKHIFHTSLDPLKQGHWYQPGAAVAALPLLVNEQAIGVISIQDPDPEAHLPYSQQSLALAIANQSAIALENARLYAQIRKFNTKLEKLVAQRTREVKAEKDRLSTLNEIALEVSSTLDLDTLLQTSLTALARITQAEYGSIMLVEQETEHLVSRAVLGQDDESNFTRIPIGTGIAGWVAQNKKPALVDDINTDQRWVNLPTGTADKKQHGSLIVMPLIAHSEVLGVLTLSHPQEDYFSHEHLVLLTASAGAIAIGIHNANMYTTIVGEMEYRSELLRHQQLETSQMSAILQSLADGVLVCDTYGEILSANPATERILQQNTEDLILRSNLHALLQQLLGEQVEKVPLADLLARPLNSRRQPRIFNSRTQVANHEIRLTLGPVLKDNEELLGAILMLRDITLEVESDRLKTEFIRTMSHELRTPMTAIKGFSQLLALGSLGNLTDMQREFVTTIQSNADRMISIINDVLEITKIETGSIDLDLRSVSLAEVFRGAVAEMQALFDARQHLLQITLPENLPLVRTDANRLHKVLCNLLSNAAKYTNRHGKLEIGACKVALETIPENIRNSLLAERHYLRIDIKDNGIGIKAEDQEQIFKRFYRAESPLKVEAGGTGLGLSLAKPLLELLGGRIWVESIEGKGSTFSFVLPEAE